MSTSVLTYFKVSGNIVSSVYSVGEKGADIIKEDWDYAALSKVA